jgi:hypothetical protein
MQNQWYEVNSTVVTRLLHSLQEIQFSNTCPQIPFNLIMSIIRGSCNEVTRLQADYNNLKRENDDLKKKVG